MGDILSKLINYVWKEWRVIMGAKVLFSGAVVVASLVIWVVLSWYFARVLDAKNAEIQELKTANSLLQQQISDNLKPNTVTAEPSHPKRHIYETQKDCLINVLKDNAPIFPPVLVSYFGVDSDAQNYASEFKSIFLRAGIQSIAEPIFVDPYKETGLMLGVTNLRNPSSNAQQVKKILDSCGFSIRYVQYAVCPYILPEFAKNDFDLFVGPVHQTQAQVRSSDNLPP